ncbi:MAG TPA: ATP-binding protein [Alphaproteobacteria bacterium]|nr:ATP-binding protein [Alphaproteobacteria bacterium]
MVRTRLTVLILVLLGAVLLVSGALVWTVWRAQYHLERSQISHDELDAYHAVAESAYRHFKQLGDIAISGGAANTDDIAETGAQLSKNLQALKKMTEREAAFVDPDKRAEESEEIGDVDELIRTINSILDQQTMLGRALSDGENPSDRAALVSLMEDEIDGTLRRQIESAIRDESEEVRRADEATHELLSDLVLVAGGVTVLGLILAATAIHFLSTRIRTPMGHLMTGVRELTQGRLQHRTNMTGHDEFAELGQALDGMASRLESQQKQLIEARSGLERTVAARTDELARANERLKRTDAMRQEFMANISHELRTPITVIRGEADVTLRGKQVGVGDYRDALTRIVEQARRLGKLVDDLLLIARARADALRLDLQTVPLDELLEDACGHAEALGERDITVRLEKSAEPCAALGDPDRLIQLFMILLDNAVRYSAPGQTVILTLGARDDRVSVSIRDSGAGMSRDDIENVFERFYRGEAGRSMAPQGSGLGLPIAKAIVTAHSGEITVESSAGQGTTVTVTLPRAPAAAPAAKAKARA